MIFVTLNNTILLTGAIFGQVGVCKTSEKDWRGIKRRVRLTLRARAHSLSARKVFQGKKIFNIETDICFLF